MSEMFITPIQPMIFGGKIEETKTIEGRSGAEAFQSIFKNAVDNVRTTEADLVNKQYLLATGQIEDAHTVPIAAAKAQMATDMVVSLRNKALESYNELMRISL